jgi:hypothetical protein
MSSDARVDTQPRRGRLLRRWLSRSALALLVLLGLYFTTLMRPQLFFSWARDGVAIRVHSDETIPDAALGVISLAESRIRGSTLFVATRSYPVYVCNARWHWNYFSGFNARSRGFQTALGRAAFIRPARWESNQLAGPDGRDGPRSLDRYIAHELTHMMVADHIGIIAARRLPVWLREGYAEYVARRDSFDYAATRAQLLAGDEEFATRDRYWKYLLLVTHLLDREGMDLRVLLNAPPDALEVETRIRAGITTR